MKGPSQQLTGSGQGAIVRADPGGLAAIARNWHPHGWSGRPFRGDIQPCSLMRALQGFPARISQEAIYPEGYIY